MGKDYQNKLTVFLSGLQRDLKNGVINEQEMKFLLGVFLKREMNKFVYDSIQELMPQSNKDTKSMTLVSYKKNRTFTYAS